MVRRSRASLIGKQALKVCEYGEESAKRGGAAAESALAGNFPEVSVPEPFGEKRGPVGLKPSVGRFRPWGLHRKEGGFGHGGRTARRVALANAVSRVCADDRAESAGRKRPEVGWYREKIVPFGAVFSFFCRGFGRKPSGKMPPCRVQEPAGQHPAAGIPPGRFKSRRAAVVIWMVIGNDRSQGDLCSGSPDPERKRMEDIISNLLEEARKAISEVASENALQIIKSSFLGKQGSISQLIKEIPNMDVDLRPEAGKRLNQVKNQVNELIEASRMELKLKAAEVSEDFDCTVPGTMPTGGALHPITQMCYDLNDAFRSMGFEVFQEDDITSEYYAFDKLNFPPNHPARESMDTYWLEGHDQGPTNEKLCLRPHLTGGSVRYMQTHKPPYRFVYPGRVYRNETTDAHHERAFFQYEALIVDKNIKFTDGKVMIQSILSKVFGREVPVRMRAGFFPFVEPGFEIDMGCQVCGGKGCSVCKHVGWIEVMPGGTPHPNVLRAAGLDPDEYTGFYVNIGLDRLVMMRYGVDDVRLFHSGDLRFLSQFK